MPPAAPEAPGVASAAAGWGEAHHERPRERPAPAWLKGGAAEPGPPSGTDSAPGCEPESLDKAITHTLEEARMVLPGVQALFGFQLIAAFNKPFYELLSPAQQRLHLVGMVLTALSVALMMSPAAYHRQAEQHSVSRRFLELASRLVTAGMFALMLALHVDCYLVAYVILRSLPQSLAVTLGLGLVFVGLWFVMPRLVKHLRASAFPR